MPSPGPGELRVRISAAGVTAADARLRANDAPRGFGLLMRCITGLVRPRHPVFGMEFAGVVDALGEGTTGFDLGQKVFGVTGLKGGAHAQYLTIRAAARLFPLPGGRLLPVTATLAEQLSYLLRAKRGAHRISGGVIGESKAAMQRLIALHAAGVYQPTLGEVLPFDEIAKAHASAGSRHKRGNTVVLMAH